MYWHLATVCVPTAVAPAIIGQMSRWFQSYGHAAVYDNLIIGAMPSDKSDVRVLSLLGVTRVLNLVEDTEYLRGDRRNVERALAKAGVEERRFPTPDYGGLAPDLIEQTTAQVSRWLDAGEIVYLHCRAGWQRSATVAAGVIALRDNRTVDSALQLVRTRRDTAEPLSHQSEDLQRWFESRATGRR